MNKPNAKTIANLICGLLLATANKNGLEINSILTQNQLLEMGLLLENKKINNKSANQILDYILSKKSENKENNSQIDAEIEYKTKIENAESIEEIATKLNVLQVNDDKVLAQIAQSVIENNPKQVLEFAENPKVLNFLIGQCLKLAKGQGNSQLFGDILREKLASLVV